MLQHESVMLDEALAGLEMQAEGTYIDATFGRGGHTTAILNCLSERGKLIALDRDLMACDYAEAHFAKETRFKIRHTSFSHIKTVATEENIVGKIHGILFDLGLSSPQIDDAERGFSFMQDGPLDMRMNTTQSFTAFDFVNQASEKNLAEVFFLYGEERFSRRIARAIVEVRKNKPIETTKELAELVKAANPKWEKHKHPATRVFQAIRIHVNQELDELKAGLEGAFEILGKGGRLVVISFHSLEDRIVKQFMKLKAEGLPISYAVPIREAELKRTFKRVGRAVKPTAEEIKRNVRARSAILRIGEKLA